MFSDAGRHNALLTSHHKPTAMFTPKASALTFCHCNSSCLAELSVSVSDACSHHETLSQQKLSHTKHERVQPVYETLLPLAC